MKHWLERTHRSQRSSDRRRTADPRGARRAAAVGAVREHRAASAASGGPVRRGTARALLRVATAADIESAREALAHLPNFGPHKFFLPQAPLIAPMVALGLALLTQAAVLAALRLWRVELADGDRR